jgi:hypothetical protein
LDDHELKIRRRLSTLDYIIKKYDVEANGELPIQIPNVNRRDLAKLINELNFKTGVEVGVFKGIYMSILCKANPQMKLYGVDSWKVYNDYPDLADQKVFDSYYERTKERLATFSNWELIRESSMEAVKKFEDESLDFVYIDANHEDPYITEDITEWSKKVKSGGIVSGHDYYRNKRREGEFKVIEATNKYTKDNNIKPWFVLGLKKNIPGFRRDTCRSWFWVKP